VLRDYLRLSMKSLRRRSLRSWLTVLGIVVGVAAVVALIAIGEGMQRSVEQQFETIGYNTIILGSAAGKAVNPAAPSSPTDGKSEEEQAAEAKPEDGARSRGRPSGKVEAPKAEFGAAKQAESKPEGEAPDLAALKSDLMVAVKRGDMTREEAFSTYLQAVQKGGQLTRAEVAVIYEEMMASAGESDEVQGRFPGSGQPETALVTSDILGTEVLESLESLSMAGRAGHSAAHWDDAVDA